MTRDRKLLGGEVAFLLGVLAAAQLTIDLWILFLLAGLMVAFVFLLSEERAKLLSLCVLCFVVGLVRFAFWQQSAPRGSELAAWSNREVELPCEVVAMPETKSDKQQLVLQVRDRTFPAGRILAYVSPYTDYSYGDRLDFRGELSIPENFDGFDYRRYLANKGVYLVAYGPALEKRSEVRGGFYGALYALRQRADENLNRILPAPAGNIVSAMTLGVNSAETKTVMEKFNRTGTSHVIAVSGFHMVVVIALLMVILLNAGVSRGWAFYGVTAGICCFVILSGSSASAMRSGIMAFVFLFATKVGRGGHAWNALMFSATALAFFSPGILRGDVGFQLSFLATFGLSALLPYLEKRTKDWPNWGGIKPILLSTFAAQVAVLPVLLLNFGQFPLLSFLANLLILPTVPILMVGGFALICLSFINLYLAQIVSLPVYLLVSYEIAVVDRLAQLDWGLIKF